MQKARLTEGVVLPLRYDAVAVFSGRDHHACLDDCCNLFMWGQGGRGQLGLHSLRSRRNPTQVVFPKPGAMEADTSVPQTSVRLF